MPSRRIVRASPRNGTASSAPGASLSVVEREALRPRFNWQPVVSAAVVVVVAFLVLLPIVFLVEESLNVGDPLAFPPREFGLKNYVAIFDADIIFLFNTLIIDE